MAKLAFSCLLMFLASQVALAGKFYWVGGSGNWTNTSHWAVTTGGTTFHTTIPGPTDTVYFDAASFSQDGRIVTVDTSVAHCALMDWSGIDQQVEFISASGIVLNIYGSLLLSDNLTFNFGGMLRMRGPAGVISQFDTRNKSLKCDIDLGADTLFLSGKLLVPYNRLLHTNGKFNANGHTVICRHYNTDSTRKASVPVLTPTWYNSDSLTVSGSFALPSATIFLQTGPLFFQNSAIDSNFVNMYSSEMACNAYVTGSKKLILLSRFKTTGVLDFRGGTQFFSQGFPIYVGALKNTTSLTKRIDLSTSEVVISGASNALYMIDTRLTFVANQASFHFSYAGSDTVNIFLGTDSVFALGEMELPVAISRIYSSFAAANVIIKPSSVVLLAHGIQLLVADIDADGTCGQYIILSSFCSECPSCGEASDCPSAMPQIIATTSGISVSYFKITNIVAAGNIITAVNSLNLGGATGWLITEPVASNTLYWIGGTGNWRDATHWANSSGGVSGVCIPVKGNHVVFDQFSFASSDTVFVDELSFCNNMSWAGIDEPALFTGTGKVFVTGSLILHDSLTVSVEKGIELNHSPAAIKEITAAHADIFSEIIINAAGTYQMLDTLVSQSGIVIQKGTLSVNQYGLTCSFIDMSAAYPSVFDYKKAIVTLVGQDTVWNSISDSLTVISDSGTVILAFSGTEQVIMNTDSCNFDTLIVQSLRTRIYGGGTSEMISLQKGVALEFEPGTTWSTDSLICNSNCVSPVSLSAFPGETGTATFSKTGYDTLYIADVIIQNLIADSTGGREYNAANSFGAGLTTGWIFSAPISGKTFYWTGETNSVWHNPDNWILNPSLPAIHPACIPSPADTVVFADTLFFLSSADSVMILQNAWCRVMDWSGIATSDPALLIKADLQVSDDVIFNENLYFGYTGGFSPNDQASPVLMLTPDSGTTVFDAACSYYGVNTVVAGRTISDSLVLTDAFIADSTVSLTVKSGTFNANKNILEVGVLQTITNAPKTLLFNNSDVTVKYTADFQNDVYLTLNADSSRILFPGNSAFRSYFNGGNQRFFDVEMITQFSDSATAVYTGYIYGADTFHILKVHPGIHLYFEHSKTQTFDSTFIAQGTCQNSIYLQSTQNGVAATLNSLGSDSIYTQCTAVRDIHASSGAVAVFGTNISNNSNWVFDLTPPAIASFSIVGTTCLGDSVHFANNSLAYNGILDSLSFEWYMEDTALSSVDVSPAYYFDNNQVYVVTLIATYYNGCSDAFSDSVFLYKPQISLNCSEYDTTICAGDQVTMMASSSNPSPQFFFYANGVPVMQSPDSTDYVTDSIALNEQIFAVVDYMGCLDTSSVFTFNVNPLPTIDLISSDIDATICLDDAVTLTTSGADQYMLYLNGVQYDNLDTTSSWILNNMADADEFTVFGKDTITGCQAFSNDTLEFSVLPLPVVALTSSEPDTTICDGDTVVIHASGAAQYIFYLNGSPMGPQSAVDSVVISTLSHNDIISVEGISASGCRNFSVGNLEFNVEVTPLLSFISDDVDSRICAGQQITFQAGGATEYQFFINGLSTGPLSTNNSLTSTFTNGQTVSVQGRLGNCFSFADSIFTIDVRPTITWTYSDSVICANETIDFEAEGDSVYQYFINGTPVTPLQYDSLYHASGLTNGQIIYVAGTNLACTPSPLEVVVHPVPMVPVVCSDPDTAICMGSNISFTAAGSETYGFYINGSPTGPYSTVNVFSATSLSNGDTISVQAVSTDGCHSISADTFIVEVAPNPVVSMSQTEADLTICAGDTVSFSASGATTYEYFVTGASQGAPSAVSTLTLSSLSNGNIVTVQGTSGYCTTTSSDVYQFTVNPIPTVTFSPVSGTSVCSGDTIRLLAGGALSYQFFVDGLPWGIASGDSLFDCDTLLTGNVISVEGTLVGCTGIAPVTYTVTVNDYPVLSFVNDIPLGSICYGDTVTFEGNGAQNYTFYLEGIPVSADSLFVSGDLQDGQTVTLYGYNGVCGLWADTTMMVNVNYVDVALSSDMSSTALCAGSAVHFTASGADLYEFFIDGVSQGSPSATNVFTPSAINDGQVVSVVGTLNTSGCAQTAFNDIFVHIIELPVITASPDDVFCEGDSVLLTSSLDENNHWFFEGTPVVSVTDSTIWAYEGGNYNSVVSAGSIGNVWSCGENSLGQFGDGTTFNNIDLQPSALTTHAVEVACGAEFTLVLHDDGTVNAWGRNEFGALGNGNYTDSYLPVAVGSLTGIQKIAAGNRFGMALKADGTVVSWGENTYGQLGYGNYSTSNFPFAVLNLDSVVDIAAGENHALALTQNGHVWAWGRNQAAQLGDSSQTNRNVPVLVKQLDDVVDIAAGANHSMALKSDGSLWVWGSNANGQLGTGSVISEWIPVKVNLYNGIVSFDGGSMHSLACDTMGILYAWGDNTFGQLGVSSLSGSLFPVVSDVNGGAVEVKAGSFSSYALRADSNLVSWGQNQAGQLGYSGAASVFTPQVIDQTFGIGSFDAGDRHLAVIPVHDQSCSASGITLTMDTVPVIDLVVNGLVLSTTTSGVSYQWYYNSSAIPGATGTSVTIAAIGNYYVVVTFANGCSGFSEEYAYGTGLDESGMAHMLLYPNPSNGEFTVMLSGNAAAQSWRMINAVGQVVASQNVHDNSVFNVGGIQLAPGVYSIQVLCTDGAVISAKFTVTE